MNVLSLFDGQSCGQIALKELGIMPDKYYASEIDKFAIQQTQHNFPNTIQLGSVLKVNTKTLCLSELYLYICKKYLAMVVKHIIKKMSTTEFLIHVDYVIDFISKQSKKK